MIAGESAEACRRQPRSLRERKIAQAVLRFRAFRKEAPRRIKIGPDRQPNGNNDLATILGLIRDPEVDVPSPVEHAIALEIEQLWRKIAYSRLKQDAVADRQSVEVGVRESGRSTGGEQQIDRIEDRGLSRVTRADEPV